MRNIAITSIVLIIFLITGYLAIPPRPDIVEFTPRQQSRQVTRVGTDGCMFTQNSANEWDLKPGTCDGELGWPNHCGDASNIGRDECLARKNGMPK